VVGDIVDVTSKEGAYASGSRTQLSPQSPADTAALVGAPHSTTGPESFVYPMRAPKSRTAAALLNRLLDDTLARLRISAADAEAVRPLKASPGPTAPLGDDQLASSAAFDRTLGLLLTQAYSKAKALSDHVQLVAGTADADLGPEAVYTYGTPGGPSSPNPMTVNEQLRLSEASRASAELTAAATVDAARQVLETSKARRRQAEAEGQELRGRVAELQRALRARDEAEAMVRLGVWGEHGHGWLGCVAQGVCFMSTAACAPTLLLLHHRLPPRPRSAQRRRRRWRRQPQQQRQRKQQRAPTRGSPPRSPRARQRPRSSGWNSL
jgi:hypothetical protein